MSFFLDLFPAFVCVECPERAAPVIAKPGTLGFWRFPVALKTVEEGDTWLQQRKGVRRPTQAERDAAWFGAHHGWNRAGADPLFWEMKMSEGAKGK